jgi:site-specific recombinase XerC
MNKIVCGDCLDVMKDWMAKSGRKAYGDCSYEQVIRKKILELWRMRPHGVKLGYADIARKINKLGYHTRMGRPFYANLVRRIIERETARVEGGARGKGRKKQQLESKDYLTPVEVAMCRAAIRQSNLLIFEVLLGAGLRAEELCDLDMRDLGIRHGQSQIDVVCGKFKRNRSVRIGPGLRALLEQELESRKDKPGRAPLLAGKDGQRIKYRTVYERMVALGKRSGIAKRLHPNVMRHTFGSGLYHYKKDLEYVRQQLGHASITTTQIYVKVFDEGQLEQMEGFERMFGAPNPLLIRYR